MKNFILLIIIYLLLNTSTLKAQWIEQTFPGDIDITLGIDFIDENNGIMGGWHYDLVNNVWGNAFYTTDAGTNWIEAYIPIDMRVMVDVQLFDNNYGYGVGAYNLTGTNQRQSNTSYSHNLHPVVKKYYENLGMHFDGLEEYRGCFVETTNGGLVWQTKCTFQDSVSYLYGMHFFDQQNGLVLASGPAAGSAAILKTSDGGNNWSYVYPFETGLSLNEIQFFDQLNGIVVGSFDDMINYNGVVLKTADGGNTWTKIVLPLVAALNKCDYLNNNTVLVSGTNTFFEAVIYRTTDGGVNWQEFRNYGGMTSVNDVKTYPGSGVTLIVGTLQPQLFYLPFTEITIDYGMTWYYSQLSNFIDYTPFKEELVNEAQWYLTGTQYQFQGFVLFTDNSGGVPIELISFSGKIVDNNVELNWSTATETNNFGFEIQRLQNSKIERLKDPPVSEAGWEKIGYVPGFGTTTEPKSYSFTDENVTTGTYKYRLKQIDFNGSFTYSNEIEVTVDFTPKEFVLYQNYPNPFNPRTTIKYEIPLRPPLLKGENETGGFVTLKVYDVLGNEVATLVNEEKQADVYEVEFDASSLASGMYLYKLQAGDFVQTKKMILMK